VATSTVPISMMPSEEEDDDDDVMIMSVLTNHNSRSPAVDIKVEYFEDAQPLDSLPLPGDLIAASPAPSSAAASSVSQKLVPVDAGRNDVAELEAAMVNGFQLRGTRVGRLWYTELQANAALASEYREIGRSYKAQRDFRPR
jgi:hypothetical protein